MRRFLRVALVGATLTAIGLARQNNAAPNAAVAELHAAEAACDQVVRELTIKSGYEHITPTHAVRLDDYGVVLVTDINLTPLSLMFGFGGQINKKELAAAHQSKLEKTAVIQPVVAQLLEAAAVKLASVPSAQSVVLKINFYTADFEDRTGLPESLTAQAAKGDLLALAQLKGVAREEAVAHMRIRMDYK